METDGRDRQPAESGSEILFRQRSAPDSAVPRPPDPCARPSGLPAPEGRAGFHSTNKLFAVSTKDGGAPIYVSTEWQASGRQGIESRGSSPVVPAGPQPEPYRIHPG